MRDFLRNELENQLIFGSNYVAHALVITNPFGDPEDIEYNLVNLLKGNNKPEVSNIVTGNFKDCYKESQENGMSNFGKIILPKPDINFYGDHRRGRYNMYSLDGIYEYSVEYEWLDNGIAISSTVIETIDMEEKDGQATQTKTLTANGTIPLEAFDYQNSVMTILFMNKYNVPMVRVFTDLNIKAAILFLNETDLPETHVAIDLNRVLLNESKHVEINSAPIEMKQEIGVDSCIDFNCFNNMYGTKYKSSGLKDIEFVSISDKDGSVFQYENLITHIKMVRDVNDGTFDYFIDGDFENEGKKYTIENWKFGAGYEDRTMNIINLCNQLKNEKGDSYCLNTVLVEDPEDPSKCVIDAITKDTNMMADRSIFGICSFWYVSGLSNSTFEPCKSYNYLDISGINYLYIYIAKDDIYIEGS